VLSTGKHCKIATDLDWKDVEEVEKRQNDHRQDDKKPENDDENSFDKILKIRNGCQILPISLDRPVIKAPVNCGHVCHVRSDQ